MAYIEINGVCKSFGSGTARTEILENINLHVEKGEFIAIVGYSGSGKTTLMNLLAGLEMPDTGEILVDGKRVTGPDPERGLVFQNYSLLPWCSVYTNVALAVDEIFGGDNREEKKARILKSINRVNLSDATHKKPGELSGGMRQRNSVARTLSMNPKILLLDEPLSALDALTRSVIQDQILEIREAENQTVILITNDVDEGLYMADRIIPLSTGPAATLGPETEITQLGRPRDRGAIHTDPDFIQMREEIIAYLLDQKKKERAQATERTVTLPNLKPMDISMARPSAFWGLRPKKRKKLLVR